MDRERLRSGLLGALMSGYLAYAWRLETTGATPETLLQQLLRCPFLQLTGHQCPVCGTTRSWHAALKGQWHAAFEYHPVAPLLLPVAVAATALLLLHFTFRSALRRTRVGLLLER